MHDKTKFFYDIITLRTLVCIRAFEVNKYMTSHFVLIMGYPPEKGLLILSLTQGPCLLTIRKLETIGDDTMSP